jgi:hypothetical protein
MFALALKQCRWLARRYLSSPSLSNVPKSCVNTSLPVKGRTVFAFFLAALTLKYALGSPEELVTVHEDVLDVEIVFACADSSPVPVFVPVLTICLVSGDFRLSSSSWSIFSTSDISPVAITK